MAEPNSVPEERPDDIADDLPPTAEIPKDVVAAARAENAGASSPDLPPTAELPKDVVSAARAEIANQPPLDASKSAAAAARPAAKKPPAETDYAHIPLGEEMDRAKWTLPPIGIVLIGIAVVAVVGFALGWFNRYQPAVSGHVDDVFAVQMSDGASVLSTVRVSVKNDTQKALYIRNLKGELKTADGKSMEDVPASEVDYERYFQAFPDLRAHAGPALKLEQKIDPGQQVQGTLVFGFNVTKDDFDKRQNLLITIEPYDNRAIVLAEKGATK